MGWIAGTTSSAMCSEHSECTSPQHSKSTTPPPITQPTTAADGGCGRPQTCTHANSGHSTSTKVRPAERELVSSNRDRLTGQKGCQRTGRVVGTWHGHAHASGIMNGPRVSLFSYLAARQHAGFMPRRCDPPTRESVPLTIGIRDHGCHRRMVEGSCCRHRRRHWVLRAWRWNGPLGASGTRESAPLRLRSLHLHKGATRRRESQSH